MADNRPLEIPIDSIERDFEDFLSPETNTRIIFSGPFGIGKTYFLDKFFKNGNKKYLPIFLRPVNYSLLSNEDIFRLIKYDILFQIIKDRQFIFDDIPDFTKMEFAHFFASQNLFLPLVNLLKTLPKINTLVTGAEEIQKLITKYSEGLKQINKNEKLCFLSEFRNEAETSFLLEYDQVSQLIADQLDEIAEKDGLQKVLIIDDLDRLDPEHIFRLFNVFSAHFDLMNYYPNTEEIKDNKFGFEKIIFVCDIENIRKIFTNKYGDGVDFSGYIDKFYSSQIFFIKHSFNKNILFDYFEHKANKLFFDHYRSNYITAVRIILSLLSDCNEISIRDLYRFNSISQKLLKLEAAKIPLTKLGAKNDSLINNYGLLTAMKLFVNLYGNELTFKQKITSSFHKLNLDINSIYNTDITFLIPTILLFADFENHKFICKNEKDEKMLHEIKISDTILKYSVSSERNSYRSGNREYYIQINGSMSIDSAFQLLKQAIINIIDYGILSNI